jgi:UDP-2-acetamido-3-amino-2,3-dideoxy-glucuronate N-acetyltransferase
LSLIETITFSNLDNGSANLFAFENHKNIPFEIKRVYCIMDAGSNPRGFHAHKMLKQVAVCLKGSCRFVLDDGSIKEENVSLNSPANGLVLHEMIWHEMHDFSKDCVLLVFASEMYDESDYIRSYDEFIKVAQHA